MIQNEINNHKKASHHENVVKLVEVVEDWGNYYLIQELCEKGDLASSLELSMPTRLQTSKILGDCLLGLRACHDAGFVFGDLKPSNVLIGDDGRFKLCDFGSSEKSSGPCEGAKGVRGTPAYMAPEIFDRGGEHGGAVDVWALGVMAYLMCYGAYPFDVECTQLELVEQIRNADISFGGGGRVCGDAEDFMRRCLEKNPRKRLTTSDAVAHPFLSASEQPSFEIQLKPREP